MERDEKDKAVQGDEERVPFDVVPNPDAQVDQGADEKAVRHSRDSDTDEQARPGSKDEESGITAEGDEGAHDKEFEVTWDGDDDPMNPRSMAYARKWIIVVIVSASSLCVYVDLSLIVASPKNTSEDRAFNTMFTVPPIWADIPIQLSMSN
ncbi:hypothetical protein KCU85_g3966, partial [Aureobasidium melanogenum]